jgi:outer membrane protein assembly factor BamD (BamD/ComL family)
VGELKLAEGESGALFSQASADEAAGNAGAAEKAYRRIVRDFPLTSAAPAAQFRLAASLEQGGKPAKAFDAYQELIETYRQSPQFAEALDRQFGIAMQGRTGRTSSFLGIPRKMASEDLIEMFQKIIRNAPQGSHAAEAQFEIGQIHDDGSEPDLAIASYRKVVSEYPQHPLAREAQVRVSRNYIGKVKDGSRDESNIAEAREATEEAMGLFPEASSALADTQSQIDEAAADSLYRNGRFYEKRGNLRAAMMYYAEVLKSPGSQHYDEVRDRVNEMSSRDPKLMDSVRDLKVNTKELAVPAASDVKGRAEYFGPPMLASGRVKKSGEVKRPGMRQGDSVPITPIEEPELPTGSDKAGRPDDSLLNPGSVPLPDPGAAVPPPVTPGLEPPSLGPDGGAPPEIPASGGGEKPAGEKKGEGEKKSE